MSCSEACPSEPHFHIESGVRNVLTCDGIFADDPDFHPDWCEVTHEVLYRGSVEGLFS